MAFALAGCGKDGHKDSNEHGHQDGHAEDSATSAPTITNRLDIPEQVRRNLGITFAKVESRRVASTLRMPGQFEFLPSARREYHAPLAGKVELLVRQYDKVSTGALLYRLDAPDWRKLQQDIVDAQAQIGTTSAALVQAQIAQNSGGAATAVTNLRVQAGLRHVESLRQSLATAESQADQLERLQKLVGGKLTEINAARSKVVEARTALSMAEEEAADLQRETLIRTTEGGAFASTASLTASYEAKRSEHEAAVMRLQIARSTARSILGLSDDELDRPSKTRNGSRPHWQAVDVIEIRAAAAGIVQSIEATNGAYVESAKAVLVIADPDQVRFRAVGLQSDLERLRDSMEARLIPPPGGSADPHEALPGVLVLGQEADADQRSLDIIVTPVGTAHWARPGVAAYAEAVVDDTEDPTPAIPVSAIVQDDLQKIFFRRDPEDPDKAIRVEADLGITDGQWVAVESGVKAGDEVVLGGVYQLKLAGGGKASEAGHFHSDGTFHAGKD
ncbi:MAG: efflux RND transporter periplasmic adaptor subunit [Candidatus Sumerlaeaceae bacterium]